MHPLQDFITRITTKEVDPINKARIQMLVYLLVAYFLFGLCLVAAYAYTDQVPQMIRASVISFFSALLFVILYYFNSWRVISHFILMLITVLGVWANLIFFVKGVNAATLQYIWLASALGFYMHGYRWGWVYTILNIVPVLLDAAFSGEGYFFLSSGPQVIARPIYVFVLIFDFFAIAFLHYYFFKAFNRNIITLTETKNQLNAINERLNITVDEIKELSEARMSFLSTMSHELRTPLNGVIGLTNVLLMQEPRKDQEETLSVLKFSAENLLSLVTDILDFNKLESDVVELESIPFNLSELVENIYGSIRLKASEKQLKFKVEVDDKLKQVSLNGDPTRLTQVLLNLLNNAIKFTEKGSVRLICSVAETTQKDLKVRFVIADTGIGIAVDRQQQIFEEFIQASSSINRNYGGTGLGLSIVRRVLKLHQSVIEIESIVEKGTKFTFDISYTYQDKVEQVEGQDSSKNNMDSLSEMKILVAEDNAVNLMVIKKTLNRIGIYPAVAENGQEALKMHLKNDYDLILMDLYMPEMDGYEAAKKIRALGDVLKSKIPIIALTATVNNQVEDDVRAVGMNGYLSKPFHPNDLFEELRKYAN
ncbi:Sensory/regulatory protein RpfC [compost metagenome]